MSRKPDPIAGHKCAGARLYVAVHCECGWSSGKWGAGCRASAYAEYRGHIDDEHKKIDAADPNKDLDAAVLREVQRMKRENNASVDAAGLVSIGISQDRAEVRRSLDRLTRQRKLFVTNTDRGRRRWMAL